jgi:hypothetical protein
MEQTRKYIYIYCCLAIMFGQKVGFIGAIHGERSIFSLVWLDLKVEIV